MAYSGISVFLFKFISFYVETYKYNCSLNCVSCSGSSGLRKTKFMGGNEIFHDYLMKKGNNNKNKHTQKKSSKNNRQDTGHADSSLGLK